MLPISDANSSKHSSQDSISTRPQVSQGDMILQTYGYSQLGVDRGHWWRWRIHERWLSRLVKPDAVDQIHKTRVVA